MRLIAHRGNITGPDPTNENSPALIKDTLTYGYGCEVDVWYIDKQFWLGHDEPQYEIQEQFLRYQNKDLWCHAKNLDALRIMLTLRIHCFWHQEDDYTVTSEGWIWAYPGKPGNTKTIAVMPEWNDTDVTGYGGVCSDYIQNYVEK